MQGSIDTHTTGQAVRIIIHYSLVDKHKRRACVFVCVCVSWECVSCKSSIIQRSISEDNVKMIQYLKKDISVSTLQTNL
jgi:hypothetical protein